MKQVALVFLVIVVMAAGAAFYSANRDTIGQALGQRHAVPSPRAACTAVTPEEATALAEDIVDGLNELDPAPFQRAMDLEIIFGQAIHDLAMNPKERRDFLTGATTAAGKDNQLAGRWVTSLGKENRVRLLRVREVDGHQRAQLRLLVGDGLNYLDLLIARTPTKQVRVVDYQDMATGQFLSQSIASIAITAVASITRTPLERLISGSSNDLTAIESMPKIRKLMDEGKHPQAMAMFRTLPETFRTTRTGTMIRMQIAQQISPEEHLASLQEIERLFPNDPALSLVQVDANRLSKRYAAALRAIDRVDEIVGGDPYLESMRADLLVESGDLAKARTAADHACELEPDLIDLWWTSLGVSLKADTHDRTVELLDEVRERFGVEFNDLSTIPEYARFAASPQHQAWLAKQTKTTPAAPANPVDLKDAPGSK